MPSAEEIANRLAYDFLRMGQYGGSVGPVEVKWLAAAAAAADGGADDYAEAAAEFSGVSVQSVGFEEGTAQPKVHVYLTRGSVRDIRSLPQSIDGVPVRVHKMGAITVRPESAGAVTNRANIYERANRVCCGSSCGPTSESSAGTLGALVRIAGDGGLYILSNNHVLAGCNHVPRNQPILAPSSMDGRPDARAPQEVGRHHLINELRSGDPNFVNPCDTDIALARVSDPAVVSSWQGDDVSGYDTPTAVAEPISLQRVKKFGRTTGLTFGRIEAKISTPMRVSYNAKHFKGAVWFTNVWTVLAEGSQPFALSGDSGSLVVTEDGNTAVGLVFAANSSGDYAWIIPMPCAAGAFGGFRLVGDHGIQT